MAKPTPIAVLTSDNHLQDRAWASRTTLEHDAFWAFDYTVEYAAKHKIPNIIAAGDIIDKQKNEADIADFLRQQMQFCEDNDIDFWYIQGQHEMQQHPWLNAVHRHPKHLVEYENPMIGPFTLFGIDWTPVEELQARLDEVPDQDNLLLVMHQVCDEWMGSLTTPELHFNMIPHAKHLLIGDYHGKHERIVRDNKTGRMQVFCPGSQAMQAIDEPPIKYFFVLNSDGSYESKQIPGRRFLRPPDLMSSGDVDKFIENVEGACHKAFQDAEADGCWSEICKPIVYVRYQYDIDDAYKRLDRAVGEWAHFFHKELMPKPTPQEVEEAKERKKVIEGGLVGALPQVVGDTESDVFRVSKRLLETRTPQTVLAELRQEYLADEVEEVGTD